MEEIAKLFIEKLKGFAFELSGFDKNWTIIHKISSRKWEILHVNNYKSQYFINDILGDINGIVLETTDGFTVKKNEGYGFINRKSKSLKEWELTLTLAIEWMNIVEKNWIDANIKIINEFPLKYRKGTVQNAVPRKLLPDFFRIDNELGKTKLLEFNKIAEEMYLKRSDVLIKTNFTANTFFDYCKIAYLACGSIKNANKLASGSDLYKTYADGRHEGLLNIDPDSEKEFDDWIKGTHPKKESGGHPWEIMRGGNTTHISMYVRPSETYQKKGYYVELSGDAFTRIPETIRMFLAIYKKGYPISISNSEGIRKRLLGEDYIGIVPEYDSLHMANQYFDEKDVYDVIHFYSLAKYKKKILPFISWHQLDLLRPIIP